MHKLLFISVLGLFLTGCVGVVAIPECSNTPINGIKLKSKDTAFIREGVTTSTEVFNRLGNDYSLGLYQRAVAYTWELPYCHGFTWQLWLWSTSATEFDSSRWRAFFIAFDSNNVVIATDTKHLSNDKSLHKHLELWATKHHVATNAYHGFP